MAQENVEVRDDQAASGTSSGGKRRWSNLRLIKVNRCLAEGRARLRELGAIA